MRKKKQLCKELRKSKKTLVNVCLDSGNCVTCHYFDANYHGGYCDKHRCDTDPGATCRDYWRR